MSTETTLVTTIPGDAPMKRVIDFEKFKEQVEAVKNTAMTLTVSDVNDTKSMKLARTTRLSLKDIRVAITKRHKELKEDILVEGRKIDAAKNELLAIIEPLEQRMLDQEQFAERVAEAQRQVLRESRMAEIRPYVLNPITADLGAMSDEDYSALFAGTKMLFDAKVERERKEKEDREAKEKAQAEENERIRQENERLRVERETLLSQKTQLEDVVVKSQAAKQEAEAKLEIVKANSVPVKTPPTCEPSKVTDKDRMMAFAVNVRNLGTHLTHELTEGSNVLLMADAVDRFTSWVDRKAGALP